MPNKNFGYLKGKKHTLNKTREMFLALRFFAQHAVLQHAREATRFFSVSLLAKAPATVQKSEKKCVQMGTPTKDLSLIIFSKKLFGWVLDTLRAVDIDLESFRSEKDPRNPSPCP